MWRWAGFAVSLALVGLLLTSAAAKPPSCRPKPRCPPPTPTATVTPTATPTPTPSPTGWPDASNTGVPTGTQLTPSGTLNVTVTGAVINGRDITGSVTVNAPNVTIRNSRIRGGDFFLVRSNSTGLLIEDSEIIGDFSVCHVGIGSSNVTVRRTEFTGCENGMDMSNGGPLTVEDNWIHDLTVGGGAHTDGIQIGQGAHDLTIRHNTINPQSSGSPASTSAIIMWNEGDPQNTRVRIEHNQLDGSHAAVALYCPRQPASAIYINQNRLVRGVYGYTDACTGSHVTEFLGNVDDVTGLPVLGGS